MSATLFFCGSLNAEIINWVPYSRGDIEFGISTSSGDSPWSLETGYNYGWWFDNEHAMGQTFTVSNDSQLESITTRLSRRSNTTGRFEIGLWEFDGTNTTNKIAYYIGDASDLSVGLTDAPQYTYDLSAFNQGLYSSELYILTFQGIEGSNDVFWLHGKDYSDGAAYRDISTVPVPATIWLLGSGLMVFVSIRKKGTVL